MLQKALVMLFVVAGIAIGTGCGTTANQYVYATLPDANQVIAYREDPNSGVLTQIAGSPYAVGDGVNSIVIHPSGKFLYTSNPGQGENDISLFTIGGNGTLIEGSRTTVLPNTLPEILQMDPAGNFLYVANFGSNTISVFSIDSSTGALTFSSQVATGIAPQSMILSPSGNFLYVSLTNQPYGFIEGFSISSGVLTPIAPVNTDNPDPDALAIDPSGTHLYVANSSASSSISIFTIDSAGGLAEVAGSPISDTYTNPLSLVLDPTGTYLYVANQGSSNIAAYSIDTSTGLPAILTTTTTTGAFATESNPSYVVVDPSGKYLFVGNTGSGAGVQVFSVAAGNLTAVQTYIVGNRASSIAVLGAASSSTSTSK